MYIDVPKVEINFNDWLSHWGNIVNSTYGSLNR